MTRRLFLSGPIGCGKSTLVRNALGGRAAAAGGFVTERVLDEAGALLGFDLLPARALACPEARREAARFLTMAPGGGLRDEEVFRTRAVRLLEEAASRPFAVLDEFGGFELLVPEFLAALETFLKSGAPCLGVLKSPPAAAALRAGMGLTDAYSEAAARLRRTLEDDPDTLILETGGRCDDRAAALLGAWTEEFAHGE